MGWKCAIGMFVICSKRSLLLPKVPKYRDRQYMICMGSLVTRASHLHEPEASIYAIFRTDRSI